MAWHKIRVNSLGFLRLTGLTALNSNSVETLPLLKYCVFQSLKALSFSTHGFYTNISWQSSGLTAWHMYSVHHFSIDTERVKDTLNRNADTTSSLPEVPGGDLLQGPTTKLGQRGQQGTAP